MAGVRTRYVCVFRRYVSTGGGRWTVTAGVLDDDTDGNHARWRARQVDTIAVFKVERSVSRDEAMGLTMQWLAKDRPAAMMVSQVGA